MVCLSSGVRCCSWHALGEVRYFPRFMPYLNNAAIEQRHRGSKCVRVIFALDILGDVLPPIKIKKNELVFAHLAHLVPPWLKPCRLLP